MKFYFCEKCGKRLTEQEISAGQAKDKKLRGVYCADCSEGVMTLETVPLTEDSARELLSQHGPPAARRPSEANIQPPVSHRATRGSERSSGARIAPRAAAAGAHAAPAATAGSAQKYAALGGAGIVAMVALAILFSGGSSAPPIRTAQSPEAPSPIVLAPPPDAPTALPREAAPETPPPPAEAQPLLPAPAPETPAEPAPVEPAAPAPEAPPPSTPAATPAPEVPVSQPATDSSVPVTPAPTEPEAPAPMDAAKVIEWATGPMPFEIVLSTLEADGLKKLPPEDPRSAVMEMTRQARDLENAVRKALLAKAGGRLILTNAKGQRRFVNVSQPKPGELALDFGSGPQPLALNDLAQVSIQELSHGVAGASSKWAAYLALRGPPDAAARQVDQLDEALRKTATELIEQRRTVWLEEQARAELADFEKLLEAKQTGPAKALGAKILERYAGTAALKAFTPPLEERLADLDSHGMSLRGVFLCDAKRLPDGRVELNFDPQKPLHRYELRNRSLPAYFTELEADLTIGNDGRWHRIFHVGESRCILEMGGRLRVEHLGQKAQGEPAGLFSPTPDRYGTIGGPHRIRIRAGAPGLSFQVDEHPPVALPGPWSGGRLMWPGASYQIAPSKLTVTGRLDPLWLAEMQEVAKQRAAYFAGQPVALAPVVRSRPRPETEPWLHCWTYGADKEVRYFAGWNTVGASWTAEGKEWVSPRPADRTEWYSWFWPMALVSNECELSFEAKQENGPFGISFVPRDGGIDTKILFIDSNTAKIELYALFEDRPVVRKSNVSYDTVPLSTGKDWLPYTVRVQGGKLSLQVSGQVVLTNAIEPNVDVGPLSFFASAQTRVRLRNVQIRPLKQP
ncbi:MAG: hypothetical protein HS116_19670 [Planctomycetes bacterium]|nr:hypothetical protein [Planctomycetota bacterium]